MKQESLTRVLTPDNAEVTQKPGKPLKEEVLEILKQNVQKWENAANAITEWMPKVAEADRVALAERGRQYKRNARELRELIERLPLDGFIV